MKGDKKLKNVRQALVQTLKKPSSWLMDFIALILFLND
jgi:hypothetical protein